MGSQKRSLENMRGFILRDLPCARNRGLPESGGTRRRFPGRMLKTAGVATAPSALAQLVILATLFNSLLWSVLVSGVAGDHAAQAVRQGRRDTDVDKLSD
jgi:hypothetical protein